MIRRHPENPKICCVCADLGLCIVQSELVQSENEMRGTHVRPRRDPRGMPINRLSQLDVTNTKVGMHSEGGGLYLR